MSHIRTSKYILPLHIILAKDITKQNINKITDKGDGLGLFFYIYNIDVV